MLFDAAAAWQEVLYILIQLKCAATAAYWNCGALNYFFALVMLGFVPTAGVSVIECGFVGAKGSVGTMTSGRLIFREEIVVLPGRHRPVQQQAWFLDRAPDDTMPRRCSRVIRSRAWLLTWVKGLSSWGALPLKIVVPQTLLGV